MELVIQILRALAWASMIVLAIHVIDYTVASKKMRVKKVKDLEYRVKRLEGAPDLARDSKPFLTIEDAKIRDFFIRTNFVGKLTNKDLINEFKNSLGIEFDEFKNSIINYNLKNLKEYHKKYKHCEHKQLIVDSYKDKNKEAK